MTRIVRRVLSIASCLLLLAACSEERRPVPHATAQPEIVWFPGTLNEALESARELNRPLLVFSRGHWCPSCRHLDKGIFDNPDVVARIQEYVAVRIIATAPDVQAWRKALRIGDRATIILLGSSGAEIVRLPGGLRAGDYTRLLDAALSTERSVYEIIETMAQDGQPPTTDEWRLLAYHVWARGNEPLVEHVTLRVADLAQRCPAELPGECSRLYFASLWAALPGNVQGSRTPADENQLKAAVDQVTAVLAIPSVVRENLCEVLAGSAIVRSMPPDLPSRWQLIRAWSAALRNLRADDQLPVTVRLAASASLFEINDPESAEGLAPDDLVRHARLAVRAARSFGPEKRQSAIHQAARLLLLAGEDREATMLLQKELEKTSNPYDFVAGIADLARNTDRVGETLSWLREMRDRAESASDRFHRGTYYLAGLAELKPDGAAEIESAGVFLLNEMIRDRGIFDEATQDRMEVLNDRLLEWSYEHDGRETLSRLRRRMQPTCDRFPLVSRARLSCQRFLLGA